MPLSAPDSIQAPTLHSCFQSLAGENVQDEESFPEVQLPGLTPKVKGWGQECAAQAPFPEDRHSAGGSHNCPPELPAPLSVLWRHQRQMSVAPTALIGITWPELLSAWDPPPVSSGGSAGAGGKVAAGGVDAGPCQVPFSPGLCPPSSCISTQPFASLLSNLFLFFPVCPVFKGLVCVHYMPQAPLPTGIWLDSAKGRLCQIGEQREERFPLLPLRFGWGDSSGSGQTAPHGSFSSWGPGAGSGSALYPLSLQHSRV